ncbi:MAG: YdjY domain-containing protein [Planctomycetaceae bacterium]
MLTCPISARCFALLLILCGSTVVVRAAEKPKPPAKAKPIALNKKGTVLLDKTGKRLLLKTKVVLRSGLLEMLCCLKKTKEHESILAVDSKAYVVHAGLLALGMKTGTPAKFGKRFVPPTGQELQIYANWKDKTGKSHRVDVRKWIRYATKRYFAQPLKKLPDGFTLPDRKKSELRYDKRVGELIWFGPMSDKQRDELLKLSADKNYRKAIKEFHRLTQNREMDARWVFVGSRFVVDPETMKTRYLAETGSLICVANFATATVDVAARSSATAGSEMFEPWTERVPPLGTDVTLELVPVVPKKGAVKPAGR